MSANDPKRTFGRWFAVDLRHTVEGLQSVNKLTSSAFALCVLLGATPPFLGGRDSLPAIRRRA